MKKVTLNQLHGNLKTFSKEFIGAGSRNSVVGLYRPEVRGVGKAEGDITVVDKK